jgi:hypothetical protein
MKPAKKIIGRLVVGGVLACCLVTNTQAQLLPPDGGGNGGSGSGGASPDPRRNYQKFKNQSFSLINTNTAALNDTNLYKVCASFFANTNTVPNFQIAAYGANAVVIKANHFNYSAETQDFALLVCDSLGSPVWKSVDFLGASDSQDGWLVQGLVPFWQVSDPMFFMISNIVHDCNAFYRVIPYSGPQIALSGPQPNNIVSNIITLQATITDLSGITNEQFEATIDGQPARYSLGLSNTISIDTKYNPNGPCNVYLQAIGRASVYDPTNVLADNSKTFFTGLASMPLDFENDTYLVFASDFCPTNVGTNYVVFSINKAQNIAASITDPSNGGLIASFSGYVPYAANVAIPWNFTEADGVTPYSNNTYVVTFTAFDPTTMSVTNHIDRHGVRAGAGCFMTYQWEDPATTTGNYLNNQANTYIDQDLVTLYQDLYEPLGLTQYYSFMVGANRNHATCIPYTSYSPGWSYILGTYLSNRLYYSDLTIAEAHGSGSTIGGGPFLSGTFSAQDLQNWVLGGSGPDWRLRKAALWACYTGDLPASTAGIGYSSFPDACGIRALGLQENSYMRKNCGLFFGGLLPQGNFGNASSATTAVVAEFLDQAWVCGENQYPGGCDPTYSFAWAINVTRGVYNPQLDSADPLLFGLPQMIYSSAYDDELMMLNFSHVKN